MTPPASVRLLSGIEVAPNGCWEWQGSVITSGYSQIMVGGCRQYVHRVSYETFRGPIPDGLDVDHVCHNRDLTCSGGFSCRHRRCINPEHLEAVTHRVNMLRARRAVRRVA